MNKEKFLVKNTFIYMIGSFGTKILVFLLVPLYSRIISTSDYGIYDLVITILSIAAPVISILIESATYRYLLADEYDYKAIISTGINILFKNLLIADVILAIVYLIFDIPYILSIGVLLNLQIVQSFMLQTTRGLKKNTVYAMASIVYTLTFCICNVIGLIILKQDYSCLYISAIVANMLSISVIEVRVHIIKLNIKNIKNVDTGIRKNMLLYSAPLVINTICWTIMSMCDRIIITSVLGSEANGIYAMANKFPTIITTLNSIFYLAWNDSAIIEKDSREISDFYNRIFNIYCCFQLVIISFLQIVNKLLFKSILGEAYYSGYIVAFWLYIGSLFYALSSFLGAYYNAKKTTGMAAISSLLGAVINIIINMLFIERIGIMAAAISTAIAYFVVFVWRFRNVYKNIKIKINLNNFIFCAWLIIILFTYEQDKLTMLLLIVNIIIILILYNKYISLIRKEIYRIWLKIKKT